MPHIILHSKDDLSTKIGLKCFKDREALTFKLNRGYFCEFSNQTYISILKTVNTLKLSYSTDFVPNCKAHMYVYAQKQN